MKADVMNLEAPSRAVPSKVQEQVNERLHVAGKTGRKIALVYAGLFGCAYDRASGLYQGGEKLLNDAIKRGEKMEQALGEQLGRFGRRASRQANSLQNQFGENIEQVTRTVSDTGETLEEQLEKQVERVLVNLGIPTRDRLDRLNQEIDRLNAKLDEELARKEAVHA
jgi:poly(hydroxyalkanoate) granule-associated protein